jgi:hypothetical protein
VEREKQGLKTTKKLDLVYSKRMLEALKQAHRGPRGVSNRQKKGRNLESWKGEASNSKSPSQRWILELRGLKGSSKH